MYINGIGCISPQPTFNNQVFLEEIKEYNTNRIYCVDTDYSKFFDVTALRRMSRIVKYGTAAGLIALNDAGIKTPDAISTGTGYGLLELSQRFLRDFISTNEGVVSPTSFIQSTHNTVSSNIALLTACHGHNNTFSQKWFSLESALYDAQFLLKEGKQNVLVGTYEEIGEFNYASLMQTNDLQAEPCSNLAMFSQNNDGVIVGEGAAYFLMAHEQNTTTYCKLKAFKTAHNNENIEILLQEFLAKNNLRNSDVDVVMNGMNGDKSNDAVFNTINKNLFEDATQLAYKHLCGEHMTAVSFAIYAIAQIFKQQQIPSTLVLKNAERESNVILLHNKYKSYHSFFIFEKC